MISSFESVDISTFLSDLQLANAFSPISVTDDGMTMLSIFEFINDLGPIILISEGIVTDVISGCAKTITSKTSLLMSLFPSYNLSS